MATASVSGPAREHPVAVTAALSAVGYVLVAGAFLGLVPIPEVGAPTVKLLSDLIAIVNTAALVSLLAGYRFIRRREIRRHRAAMLTAFSLIMVFLILYLVKVGGGFEKAIVIERGQFLAAYAGIVRPIYLAMLAVHVLLSVVSVPVVLYAVLLGLTRSPAELAGSPHPRVGRIAVAAWTLSLSLGIATYVMLNHVYGWEVVERSLLVLLAVPARGR